jgi:hypothetical protein
VILRAYRSYYPIYPSIHSDGKPYVLFSTVTVFKSDILESNILFVCVGQSLRVICGIGISKQLVMVFEMFSIYTQVTRQT